MTPPQRAKAYLRIWRTRIDLSRLGEYERFVAEHSQPMFVTQPGFRGVFFSRAGNEVAVLSCWEDDAAVEALEASETYRQTVRAIEATGLLTADFSLEVYELHAGVLDRELIEVLHATRTEA